SRAMADGCGPRGTCRAAPCFSSPCRRIATLHRKRELVWRAVAALKLRECELAALGVRMPGRAPGPGAGHVAPPGAAFMPCCAARVSRDTEDALGMQAAIAKSPTGTTM